jgi:hypothetical protein
MGAHPDKAVMSCQVDEDDVCSFDWGLFCEPTTLLCGHTFCRHCVLMVGDDGRVGAAYNRAIQYSDM